MLRHRESVRLSKPNIPAPRLAYRQHRMMTGCWARDFRKGHPFWAPVEAGFGIEVGGETMSSLLSYLIVAVPATLAGVVVRCEDEFDLLDNKSQNQS